MIDETIDYRLLWAKTVKKDASRYHPLPFHMLDVAGVAYTLWQEWTPHAIRARIAKGLGLSVKEAGFAVALLAGLHDLGKASPGFEAQWHDGRIQAERLGLRFSENDQTRPHGLISAREITRLLGDGTLSWRASEADAEVLARISGAHHGVFPSSDELLFGPAVLGDRSWTGARDGLALLLTRWLTDGLEKFGEVETGPIRDPALVAWLAGFISVADWIGSSVPDFRPGGCLLPGSCIPLEEYARDWSGRAEKALRRMGWLPGFKSAGVQDEFSAIFPFIPNPMQSQVAALAREAHAPYLMIIEEQMGGGKTEAALFCADQALCRGYASGLYVGLPTQATSNAMHDRVRDEYLKKRGHVGNLGLLLVHGNALLHQGGEQLEATQIYREEERNGRNISEPGQGRAEAESWFTGRKRPLLAPFGVGTVDQSLMAVLQTRHWFVRLFGLAGKVVVFDEVHAYDVYMTELFGRLLRWLSVMDCTVIILSATLPNDRRKALVNAYLGREPEEAVQEARYPRLTMARRPESDTATRPETIQLSVNEDRRTEVEVEWSGANLDIIAERLRRLVAEGMCVAVVCSTVARAQQVFRHLREDDHLRRLVADDRHWHLLHARLPFAWRQTAEGRFLKQFGRRAVDEGTRPKRAVIVGTSVLEQSLDYDVDVMLSDPAPVDLWLQRMGRIHRFAIAGRTSVPRFIVLCVEGEDGPRFGDARYVYEPYILLRSWLALKSAKNPIRLPHDIEDLVEAVYGVDRLTVPDVMGDAMEAARSEMERKRRDDKAAAQRVLVTRPRRPSIMINKFNAQLDDGEDPRIHKALRAATRLGQPTVQAICLVRTELGVAPATSPDEPVELGTEPDRQTVLGLLRSALPISHRGIFEALKDEEPPTAWKAEPHLRFHRYITFENGQAEVAGLDLHLDPVLGLEIPRSNKEGDDD